MTIHVKLIVLIASLLLFGCADYAKVDAENIASLALEPSDTNPINHGATFGIEVVAILKNGDSKRITKHPNLTLESEYLARISPNEYKLIERPISFEDTNYALTLSFKDETNELTSVDSLHLNYQDGLWIHTSAQDGDNGRHQRKGGATLFSRHGVDGKNGDVGAKGDDGGNYTAYIWMINRTTHLRIENDSTGIIWKYKSNSCDTLVIDLSGGNGGNASDGGEGGNGKNGSGSKVPGNGGNGGNGGEGGDGGNGGSILLFVHTNAQSILPQITILRASGQGGNLGNPGIGGVSGKAIKNQRKGTTGKTGEPGVDGKNGTNGPKPVISIINF